MLLLNKNQPLNSLITSLFTRVSNREFRNKTCKRSADQSLQKSNSKKHSIINDWE